MKLDGNIYVFEGENIDSSILCKSIPCTIMALHATDGSSFEINFGASSVAKVLIQVSNSSILSVFPSDPSVYRRNIRRSDGPINTESIAEYTSSTDSPMMSSARDSCWSCEPRKG